MKIIHIFVSILKYWDMIDEIKQKFKEELDHLREKVRFDDPIYNYLKDDPVGEYEFINPLRMLPLELIEAKGPVILQEVKEYQRYYDPKSDYYRQLWDQHHLAYYEERIRLIQEYQTPPDGFASPLEVFNRLSDRMIKNHRRALLLLCQPQLANQTQNRLSGDEVTYLFVRSYWVDEKGQKKRLFSRHIGERLTRLEREVGDLFHRRGFGVLWNFRSESGVVYDMVIQRGDMRTVVEIKLIDDKSFTKLFLFDELLTRFDEDYPDRE